MSFHLHIGGGCARLGLYGASLTVRRLSFCLIQMRNCRQQHHRYLLLRKNKHEVLVLLEDILLLLTIQDERAKILLTHDELEDENDGYKIKITQLESAIRRIERQSSMDIRARAQEADSRYITQ